MANIKISELNSETALSENHILITEQENATETKKSTLGLLLNWIVNKLPIATADKVGNVKSGGDIMVGTDGTVTVNSVGGKTVKTDVPENALFTDTVYELPVASNTVLGGVKVDGSTITVDEEGIIHSEGGSSGTTINNWTENTEYNIGDLVINSNTLYQCSTAHTSGETFENTNWTALSGEKGDKGDKGDNGTSPTVTVTQTDTGATITIVDSEGETTANLLNGSDGTNGIDGITPHIDKATKHWFVGEEDTGVMAEGTTTVSTTSVEYTSVLTADNWVGDTAPYTQAIEVVGMTSETSPIIDVVVSENIDTGKEEATQWSYITKAVSNENIITFTCYESKPTIDLNIKVKVV